VQQIQIDDLINIHVVLHLGSFAYSADRFTYWCMFDMLNEPEICHINFNHIWVFESVTSLSDVASTDIESSDTATESAEWCRLRVEYHLSVND